MKTTETFSTFHTHFLHLAGQAQILQKDLLLDLFNKLILDLQRAVLPVFTTVQTLKELTDQCLAIDQGLCRIKAHADWMKARNPLNQATSNAKTAYIAPVQSATPITSTTQPLINLTASYITTPTAPLIYTWPIYKSLYIQALND